jgi:hypothetical protein
MQRRRAPRAIVVIGLAAAGVVLGHWLAYRLVVPEPHVRAEVLARTGHGYWDLAVRGAVVLGVAAAALTVLAGIAGRDDGAFHGRRLALRLAAAQLLAFSSMEVAERVVAGAPVAGLLHHGLFLAGLALQVVLAVIGAAVLFLLGRATVRLMAALRPPRPLPLRPARWLPVAGSLPPRPALAGAASPRGPPTA